jgi:biotin carboxylase
METKTIWINQWFSTAYHIVSLIRQDERFAFRVIGTNGNAYSPVRLACDEWAVEPPCADTAYLDYCAAFCREHAVDVFIPRRGMGIIARNRERFGGTRVLAETDPAIIELCGDKIAAYRRIAAFLPQCVPEFAVARDAESFIAACADLSARSGRICCKASRDEGGASFRIIPANADRARLAALFAEFSCSVPLMVLPYLDGAEVSVDVLRTASGAIMVPRFKPGGRHEYTRYDETILSLCSTLLERIALDAPCNIQFKYRGGVPYLLEINTRMSGGVQYAALAAGVNIPNIAVNQLLGVEKAWRVNRREVHLSYIETPVILPDDPLSI